MIEVGPFVASTNAYLFGRSGNSSAECSPSVRLSGVISLSVMLCVCAGITILSAGNDEHGGKSDKQSEDFSLYDIIL